MSDQASPPGGTTPDPQVHEIGKRRYLVAPVEPLDVGGVRTVMVGTVLWLVALLMLLPFVGELRAHGTMWWLWTCATGFGLGLIGYDLVRRRVKTRQTKNSRSAS